MRDYGVSDYVKSISWCGDNICLGIKKEYVILNTANGTLSEVFPSGRVAPPLVISLPSGELLLGKVIICFPLPLFDVSARFSEVLMRFMGKNCGSVFNVLCVIFFFVSDIFLAPTFYLFVGFRIFWSVVFISFFL